MKWCLLPSPSLHNAPKRSNQKSLSGANCGSGSSSSSRGSKDFTNWMERVDILVRTWSWWWWSTVDGEGIDLFAPTESWLVDLGWLERTSGTGKAIDRALWCLLVEVNRRLDREDLGLSSCSSFARSERMDAVSPSEALPPPYWDTRKCAFSVSMDAVLRMVMVTWCSRLLSSAIQ